MILQVFEILFSKSMQNLRAIRANGENHTWATSHYKWT